MNVHMHITYIRNTISRKRDHEADKKQEGLKGEKEGINVVIILKV